MRLNPIPQDKFAELHAMFLERMLHESDGVPFTSFKHRFVVVDVIRHQRRIYKRGEDALYPMVVYVNKGTPEVAG